MKAIDYIVDFIFDKIFRTSSLEILKPPQEEKSFYKKLKEKIMKESADKEQNKTGISTNNNMSITRSILKNSPEKNLSSTLFQNSPEKKFSTSIFRNSLVNKSVKFGDKSFITRTEESNNKEINLNDYATPKFTLETEKIREKILIDNPENTEHMIRPKKSVRISDIVLKKNRDSIIKLGDNTNEINNPEIVVRHPENIEEENKQEDLASIVKTLRKKYDTSTQSKKSGRSLTLKEMILSKNKSNLNSSLSPTLNSQIS